MVTLKKLRNGVYYETISNRYIEKKGNEWHVINECHGEIYFKGSTLKSCKEFQNQENAILSWSKN